MTLTELGELLYAARERTLSLFLSVDASEFIQPPAPERWSLAMVADHLRLVDQAAAAMIGRLVKRTRQNDDPGPAPSDIQIDGDIDTLVDSVMDYPVFRTAEPATDPPAGVLNQLAGTRAALEARVTEALEIDCRGRKLPHPVLGPLNAYEWIAFVSVHETGHHGQIRAILSKLSE